MKSVKIQREMTMLLFVAVFFVLLTSTATFAATNEVFLTTEEVEFINNSDVLRVAVYDSLVPYTFRGSEGDYNGISIDFLELVSAKTGLKYEIIPDLSWDEAYNSVVSGKNDMLICVAYVRHREDYIDFSVPYFNFYSGLVTRSGDPFETVESLKDRKVAVMYGSIYDEYLRDFSDAVRVYYRTEEEALENLGNGNVDAYLGAYSTSLYYIRDNDITNLNLDLYKTGMENYFHFATSKGSDTLLSIINKGLTAIEPDEKEAISERWVGVIAKETIYNLKRMLLTLGVGILAASLLSSWFWIHKLRGEVKKRKGAENELLVLNEKLKIQSRTDFLTDLTNTRGMHERLDYEYKRYKRYGVPFSLVVMDLDHFKDINDKFGHDTGDDVLRGIADIMKKSLRETDIISRWGGEEFLILLGNTRKNGAITAIENLRKKLEEKTFSIKGEQIAVTASFGICEFDGNKATLEQAIKMADEAMYEAKDAGRNKVVVNEGEFI